MVNEIGCLPPEERVRFSLRALYERYDYRPYRMSQFEEYSLYAENRSFLQSPRVITFTDLDGRMMALKPDVTLSIVRHAAKDPRGTEKLYYTENVFRPSAQSRAFREISQIGVEAIGEIDLYQTAEVVALAAMSLESIAPQPLLEISHVGFTVALLEALGLTVAQRARVLGALGARNVSALSEAADAAGLDKDDRAALCALPALYGEAQSTLDRARALCRNKGMEDALSELQSVVDAAQACCRGARLQLDFSFVGDTDYYSGLMLRGYIDGLPRAVLLGGRYDNILKKLGKRGGGIGFAIDLSGLSRLPAPRQENDIDLLIRYAPGCDAARLLALVVRETKKGLRVRALPEGESADGLAALRTATPDELEDYSEARSEAHSEAHSEVHSEAMPEGGDA